jgi:predicted RNA-binding protein associated with RNAse of E/G family
LWLDVATPSSGRSYQLLDSGEFGHAIADGLVSRNMAAYALSSLDDLVGLFHDGSFPTQEIARAEQTAIELGR